MLTARGDFPLTAVNWFRDRGLKVPTLHFLVFESERGYYKILKRIS